MPDMHFAAAKREATEEPLTFTLAGEMEPFEVPLPLPAWAALELAEQRDQAGAAAIIAATRFIKACIREEDHLRFSQALIRNQFDYEDVAQIVVWLTQVALGVPTERPLSSPQSPRPNGKRSKATASTGGSASQ